MDKIQLFETIDETDTKYLVSPKISGTYRNTLCENMLKSQDETIVNGIFLNANKVLQYFAAPCDKQNITRVLCLGKVQSGKTAFFIAATALAFDNGYDIAYVMGGTKNTLRDQNLERIKEEFLNNDRVKVLELNNSSEDEINSWVSEGYKVIAVVLKNAAQKKNIGKLKSVMLQNSEACSLIIDDEGDEYTPGAPKEKRKSVNAGKTHDAIAELLTCAKCVTYLSVTATPQANFLISTIDKLSPDHIVLVEPGNGYTGGNAFHDTLDNPHLIRIKDSDDFIDSIPTSFMDALYFFIFACSLKRSQCDYEPYSMLVHPSSLTRVHEMVANKIDEAYDSIYFNLSNPSNIAYQDQCERIKEQYYKYCKENSDCRIPFKSILNQVGYVLSSLQIAKINANSDDELSDEELYKIYVGGNMLGRGLTIKNLCVTYIYRESKIIAIDTLYQRARWFGYKSKYFDICKVYMTNSLCKAFRDTVDSENDMWNAIRAFLCTNKNIKLFPRVFRLDNDKLVLTRKTISKTVTLNRVNPGYSYNKSVLWSNDEKKQNRDLFNSFFLKWEQSGHEETFDTSSFQTHYIISMTFTDFFTDFLSKYNYPKESSFGVRGFESILDVINKGTMEDSVKVIIMRYKTNQFRSLSPSKYTISELPQGWNEGTQYKGDKLLPGFHDKFHFQIHNVYIDREHKSEYMPMIAMNNPITEFSARYVTGDNDYETV